MHNIYHQPKRKVFSTIIPAAIISAIFYLFYFTSNTDYNHLNPVQENHHLSTNLVPTKSAIQPIAKYFLDYPLNGPKYRDQFGEFGRRIQILQEWIELSDTYNDIDFLENTVEKVARSMFPFIINTQPEHVNDSTTLTDLRNSYIPGSKGIVIPTGSKGFRFAIHLATAIREVFNCTLPIQVTYAGEGDLPYQLREVFSALVQDVEFLDITYVFNEKSMSLKDGGWAVKSFSALASKFEQTIVLDADVVFVQSPEVLFNQTAYKDTGALIFHDRLLWKDWFKERHEWWHKQMENNTPSKALNQSLVWTERYSEEADSGVVVLDKSRLSTFMGLLHVCWQNTGDVRKEATYKLTHGDKESWWFGLELANASFAFEKHYGFSIGHLREKKEEKDPDRVCGFTIAHVDEHDKLLWYNGSLLKNKLANLTEFDVPSHWMMDGVWEKGNKDQHSCMKEAPVRNLTQEEILLLTRTVELSQKYDEQENLVPK